MSDEQQACTEEQFTWAIVEIFGHRKHAGRIREEERFGAKMLRIDVPEVDPAAPTTVKAWITYWYGGASVFSMKETDEATVMKAVRPYVPASRYLAPPDDEDDELPF